MPGRRKDRIDRYTSIESLTASHYNRAYRLFRAGVGQKQILVEVGLTGGQYHHMLNEGLELDGANLPPFLSALTDEVLALRENQIDAARAVSEDGVDVLRRSMKNAQLAGRLISRILGSIANRINEGVSLEEAMPSDSVMKALRSLERLADGSRAASTFQTIYGAAPSLHPGVGVPLDQGGHTAAVEAIGEVAATDAADHDLQSILSEMGEWTPEQLARYAEHGEEPTPDVLDVETDGEYDPEP